MSPECSYSHSVVFFSIKQLRVQQSPVQTVRWDSHTPYRFTTIIYTLTVQQTPSNQQLELDLITSCSNRFIIILSVYMLFCHSVFTKPGSRISGSMYQKPWIKKKKILWLFSLLIDLLFPWLIDWLHLHLRFVTLWHAARASQDSNQRPSRLLDDTLYLLSYSRHYWLVVLSL